MPKDKDESLRDTLEAAFKADASEQSDAERDVDVAGEADKVPADEASGNEDGAVEKSAVGDGAGDKPDDGDAGGDSPPGDADGDVKNGKPDEGDKSLEPPARWTKDQKEEFLGLDPKIQKILLDRNKGLESSYTKGMTELAQERQRYQGIEEALAPFRDGWSRQGMSDEQALKSIMSYFHLSHTEPKRFLELIAQERGIDLQAEFGPSQEKIAELAVAYAGMTGDEDDAHGDVPRIHPQVQQRLDALTKQNEQLTNALGQLQNGFATQQQTSQQQLIQRAKSELEAFRTETDANGQPVRPFYEDVREDMQRLYQAGISNDLQDAYDRAVHMRPDIRAKMSETAELQRKAEDDRRRREEAARAKRAGASVSASASPVPKEEEVDESNLSLRQIIESEFAKAGAGARI